MLTRRLAVAAAVASILMSGCRRAEKTSARRAPRAIVNEITLDHRAQLNGIVTLKAPQQYVGREILWPHRTGFLHINADTGVIRNTQVARRAPSDPPGGIWTTGSDAYEFIYGFAANQRWVVITPSNQNWYRMDDPSDSPGIVIYTEAGQFHGEIKGHQWNNFGTIAMGAPGREDEAWIEAAAGGCLHVNLRDRTLLGQVPCPAGWQQGDIDGYRYTSSPIAEGVTRFTRSGFTPPAPTPTTASGTVTETPVPGVTVTAIPTATTTCVPPIRDHFGNLVNCDGTPWITPTAPGPGLTRTKTPIPANCRGTSTTLCLSGRFAVSVTWKTVNGNTGVGQTLPFTWESGLFWFFQAGNAELLVKVLDGRALNGKWWVLYAAATNVEFTMTVKDTDTGAVKTYTNPQGRMASAADTEAFR